MGPRGLASRTPRGTQDGPSSSSRSFNSVAHQRPTRGRRKRLRTLRDATFREQTRSRSSGRERRSSAASSWIAAASSEACL